MASGDDRRRSRSSSDSDSSASREERRAKKHKKDKKDKKEKEKKHKHKHKKHKRRSPDADDERVRAAKAFLEAHLKQQGGAGAGATAAAAAAAAIIPGSTGAARRQQDKPVGMLPPGAPLLEVANDYFARAPEFTAWLQELRGLYFNELSSEQTHGLFEQFVTDWNTGQLPSRFYAGLAAAPAKRTSHSWGFAAKSSGTATPSLQRGMAAFLSDEQQQQAAARTAGRAADAADRRGWRREQRELVDELLPRATGGSHDARVEARMARREAARAREESPDTVPVTGGGNIMGGDDSFAAAKAREAKRHDWRNRQQEAKREQLAVKLSAAAAAEEEKMAAFRALVAAQGGRIAIPKRE